MSDSRRFYGVYRANVYSNSDPLKQRRVRLRIPQVLADQPSEWVWPKDSSTANFDVPAVGQGAFVMFEGGDPNFPIWVGTFGDNKSADKQIKVKNLPNQATYPSSILFSTNAAGKKDMDLIGSVLDIASKLDSATGVTPGGTPLHLPTGTSIGDVTADEITYLSGVTGPIQGQVDLKSPIDSPTFTGTASLPADTSIGTVTSTELGYVGGATSNIQDQLDAVGTSVGTAAGDISTLQSDVATLQAEMLEVQAAVASLINPLLLIGA